MTDPPILFRILRYLPGRIDPPAYQDYRVPVTPAMTVLDGLETIRLRREPGLIYRHCCHHASCGTCACTIDGTPALACTTRLDRLDGDIVTLEPLAGYRCIGDLAVDNARLFTAFDPHWDTLRPCENASSDRTPYGVDRLMRLENCIECGCCLSACPVMGAENRFLGPAALAAVNSQRRNHPGQAAAMLAVAAQSNGVSQCKRHVACSRVCPSDVYPARHIADLQRAVSQKSADG